METREIDITLEQAEAMGLIPKRQASENGLPHAQMDAQYSDLLIAFNTTRGAPLQRFAEGEAVRFKPVCGSLKNEYRGKIAYRFWAYLKDLPDDVGPRMIEEASGAVRHQNLIFDCVIGWLLGGAVSFEPADSSMLEPVPAAEVG